VAVGSEGLKDRSKAIRFSVRSLGWVEIAEEDLTPERSSKAVNRCIVDLSLGRNDLLDVVGRWGDVTYFHTLFTLDITLFSFHSAVRSVGVSFDAMAILTMCIIAEFVLFDSL